MCREDLCSNRSVSFSPVAVVGLDRPVTFAASGFVFEDTAGEEQADRKNTPMSKTEARKAFLLRRADPTKLGLVGGFGAIGGGPPPTPARVREARRLPIDQAGSAQSRSPNKRTSRERLIWRLATRPYARNRAEAPEPVRPMHALVMSSLPSLGSILTRASSFPTSTGARSSLMPPRRHFEKLPTPPSCLPKSRCICYATRSHRGQSRTVAIL